MADVHENKTNKEEVRLMTYEDEANYDDVTIEEVLEEEQPQGIWGGFAMSIGEPEPLMWIYCVFRA